jgi:hypothetical protein
MANGHYTAVLEITHTSEPSKPEQLPGRVREANSIDEKRTVREVSRVIVRSDTIESLISKTNAHLNLVEDYRN